MHVSHFSTLSQPKVLHVTGGERKTVSDKIPLTNKTFFCFISRMLGGPVVVHGDHHAVVS